MLGGGFIGPETAENLIHRGFSVTLVEVGKRILAPMDPDMARIAEGYVERHGLRLALNGGVAGLEHGDQGTLKVLTLFGKVHPEDILGDADPAAERAQGPQRLRRHAVAFPLPSAGESIEVRGRSWWQLVRPADHQAACKVDSREKSWVVLK